MPKKVNFLCLANSQKMGGRCIAGISLKGGWVRFVSNRPDGELVGQEYRLGDGTDPRHFDVIEAGVEKKRAEIHQPENFVISQTAWDLKSRVLPSKHQKMLDAHLYQEDFLFGAPGKQIAFKELKKTPLKASLALFAPENPQIIVGEYKGKRKVRTTFSYRGTGYDFGVTDLDVKRKGNEVRLGIYDLRAFLGASRRKKLLYLASITEPFDPTDSGDLYCYKLIASILAV